MEATLVHFDGLELMGHCSRMSFAANTTQQLWQGFMPHIMALTKGRPGPLYSVDIYPGTDFFHPFDPTASFDKWAAISAASLPVAPSLESLFLPAGLYTVFLHRGPAGKAAASYRYIFETWLPQSDYLLDDRPHFALMDERYRHEAEDSEEEIWIPVRAKKESPALTLIHR